MTKKRLAIVTVALAILCGAFYFCCGLFIVYPLGVSPEGSTYLYWRIGTDLPFISSADGLLLQQSGSPTAAARAQRSVRCPTSSSNGESPSSLTPASFISSPPAALTSIAKQRGPLTARLF